MKVIPFVFQLFSHIGLQRYCIAIALVISAGASVSVSAQFDAGGTDTSAGRDAWIKFWGEASSKRHRKLDEHYIQGQKVYLGKAPYKKYNYCLPAVDNASERIELNRRSLRRYRKGTVIDFINALYNCDAPEKHVLSELKKKDAGMAIYYLNKRYKLKLKQK